MNPNGLLDEVGLQKIFRRREWIGSTSTQVPTNASGVRLPRSPSPNLRSSTPGSPSSPIPAAPSARCLIPCTPLQQPFSIDDLLAAAASIDSGTTTIRFLSIAVPELEDYLLRAAHCLSRIVSSIQRSISYRCCYCGRRTRSSTTRCCPSRDPSRAAARRVVTIVQFGVRRQLQEILETNLLHIVKVHERIHAIANGSIVDDSNKDFYDCEQFRQLAESEASFLKHELRVQLVLNVDGFPASKRFSITPVLLQVGDLPAHLRGKQHNIAVQGVLGARGKISLDIWEEQLLVLKRSLECSDFMVKHWRIRASLVYSAIDAEMARYMYNHVGWAGHYGCFTCFNPGPPSADRRGGDVRPTMRHNGENGDNAQFKSALGDSTPNRGHIEIGKSGGARQFPRRQRAKGQSTTHEVAGNSSAPRRAKYVCEDLEKDESAVKSSFHSMNPLGLGSGFETTLFDSTHGHTPDTPL